MKKLVAVLILFVLAVSFAIAEEVTPDETPVPLLFTPKDLKLLDEVQFMFYYNMIKDEAIERNIVTLGEVFPSGLYIGGETIKPGTYIVTMTGSGNCNYKLYSSKEAYNEQQEPIDSDLMVVSSTDTSSLIFTINDGMALDFRVAFGTPTISADKPSWMP